MSYVQLLIMLATWAKNSPHPPFTFNTDTHLKTFPPSLYRQMKPLGVMEESQIIIKYYIFTVSKIKTPTQHLFILSLSVSIYLSS